MNDKVAVFDVCGTIYNSNTTFDFLEYYFLGQSWWKYLLIRASRTLIGKLTWKAFETITRQKFRRMAVGLLRGSTTDVVSIRCKKFIDLLNSKKQNRKVLELIDKYKKEHFSIVLVSASISLIVAEVAKSVGANAFFSSELEVKDAVITGDFRNDIQGCKKNVILMAYPDLKELVVVTDNKEDREILEIASTGWIISKRRHRRYWHIHKTANSIIMEC